MEKITREELHLLKMAIEELRNHDRDMVEIGKDLNDENGVKVFKDEIESIDILEEKLNTLIKNYYD